MDRLSSSSAFAIRTEALQPTEPPEDMIAKIIATIGQVDNQTLASLAQTCKDLWRIASVDTLRSFFFAAREAYEGGDNGRKVAVFCVLTDWIDTVADQLPETTRWEMIGELSHRATIGDLGDPELSRMIASTHRLIELAMHEIVISTEQRHARLDLAENNQAARASNGSVELMISMQRLIAARTQYMNLFAAGLSELNRRLEQLFNKIG